MEHTQSVAHCMRAEAVSRPRGCFMWCRCIHFCGQVTQILRSISKLRRSTFFTDGAFRERSSRKTTNLSAGTNCCSAAFCPEHHRPRKLNSARDGCGRWRVADTGRNAARGKGEGVNPFVYKEQKLTLVPLDQQRQPQRSLTLPLPPRLLRRPRLFHHASRSPRPRLWPPPRPAAAAELQAPAQRQTRRHLPRRPRS